MALVVSESRGLDVPSDFSTGLEDGSGPDPGLSDTPRSAPWIWARIQPSIPGALSDCCNTAVKLPAASVEDDGFDTQSLGALGHKLPNALSLGGLGALERAKLGLERGGVNQSDAMGVVHDLDEDVARGTAHDHSGRFRGTG